jgi:hypothetical protein
VEGLPAGRALIGATWTAPPAASHLIRGSVLAVPRASFASLQLARFDALRTGGPFAVDDVPGVLFSGVAADTRAAGTDPASHQAFTFALLGLHEDAASARRLVGDAHRAPWLTEASEVWRGVLQPFRHKGAANHADRAEPGPMFEPGSLGPAHDGPFVAITTSGWTVGAGLDMNRVREFGAGVLAVRASMTALPGLHSQHSFFFPRVLECDPMTVTFWRDDDAIRGFAYGPGSHRRQIDRHRAESLADRTSFTRYRVLESSGTWHGSDPVGIGDR